MSGHTPAPWFNGQDGFNLGNGVVYARHANGNPKDVATIRGWGGEQQANSRLIAAAPDLLEALEAMIVGACAVAVHHAGERATLQMAVDMATKVIARAKGEPQ